MVLLFTHSQDASTNRVSAWLTHLRKQYFRFNENDLIRLCDISFDTDCALVWDIELENGKRINSQEITNVYFRAGSVILTETNTNDVRVHSQRRIIQDEYASYITNYSIAKNEFIIYELYQKRCLGTHALGRYNKILALKLAKLCGLEIPLTLITTSKAELASFWEKHKCVVTKSIDIGFDVYDEQGKGMYNLYTTDVSENLLKSLPDEFPLSKFQVKVEKQFEIRVFYLRGMCYSAAIFSQQAEETQTDYRRIRKGTFNRVVPYKLPVSIEQNITKFMHLAKLDIGSIDIIKDNNGKYVFLEVNPVGQFGYISGLCNYNLHMQIAKSISE